MLKTITISILLVLMCGWTAAQTLSSSVAEVTTSAGVVTTSGVVATSAGTSGPTTVAPCTIKCEIPDGYFVDHDDPHWFYRCVRNRCVAHLRCQNETVWNNEDKSCIVPGSHVTSLPNSSDNPLCPNATGKFPYPGNPHKFIECFENRAFIEVCASDLVFNEKIGECDYNDQGLTWPADPTPAPTTPKPVATTSQVPVQTTQAPVASTNTFMQSTAKVYSNDSSVLCTRDGFYKDSNDEQSFHLCENGKELTFECPEESVFDEDSSVCTMLT